MGKGGSRTRNAYGENIQVCHKFPAQNRYSGASPLTCNHFPNKKKREFEKPDQAGYKYPAQNRFTVTYPLTGGHFCFASNYSATTSAWDTAGKGPGKGGSCQGKGTS